MHTQTTLLGGPFHNSVIHSDRPIPDVVAVFMTRSDGPPEQVADAVCYRQAEPHAHEFDPSLSHGSNNFANAHLN